MKKRLMALLLAVLIMSAFASCAKGQPSEEPSDENDAPSKGVVIEIGGRAPDPQNYGEFYTDENGRWQNKLITLELVTKEMVAPVTELTYRVHNASTCLISDVNTLPWLYKNENGAWVCAPSRVPVTYHIPEVDDYNYLTLLEKKMVFGGDRGYYVLEPGEYRLIVVVGLHSGNRNNNKVELVADFTVSAPAQAIE